MRFPPLSRVRTVYVLPSAPRYVRDLRPTTPLPLPLPLPEPLPLPPAFVYVDAVVPPPGPDEYDVTVTCTPILSSRRRMRRECWEALVTPRLIGPPA